LTREETFNLICTVLEEYLDETIEHIADRLIAALALTGDDLLDHLDPPVGLKHWLVSHGLSLVVTHTPPAPAVWALTQGEDEEDAGVEDLEEGEGGTVSLLKVGDVVEYRTAPGGPNSQVRIGSGRINAVTSHGWIVVQDSPTHEEWLNPQIDWIHQATPSTGLMLPDESL
jgi:hypothetical protein